MSAPAPHGGPSLDRRTGTARASPAAADPAGPATILVVDDSPEMVEVLSRILAARGHTVLSAPETDRALRILDERPVDVVVTDLRMPRGSGLDLVRHVRQNLPDAEVVMVTGYASLEGAVEAVKAGAEEYLAKPFTDEELEGAVHRALDKLRRRRAAEDAVPETGPSAGLLGASEAMRRVRRDVAKAAASTATVLVTGESGTGKELVARAVHYQGARAAAPFVAVNCSGIPDTLVESELFGYVRGAFTGATESRAGFFLTADGGTIFLDEIGDVSLATQAKLLRVLQEKEVTMVGSSKPRPIDVRVVAATNKDLASLVRRGAFREDLYFRLAVLTIDVPPLRDRGDDVLALARRFADEYASEAGRAVLRFTDGALRALRDHGWPGNVRELENLIQRLVVMADPDDDLVDVSDLPPSMRFAAPRGAGVQRTLAEVEAEHVRNVLASVGGNKTRAAEILGIDRKTLREKLRGADGGAAPAGAAGTGEILPTG